MKISIKNTEKDLASKVLFVSIQDTQKLPKSLEAYKDILGPIFKDKIFHGKTKESLFLPFAHAQNSQHLILVGLGEDKNFSYEKARRASATAFKQLQSHQQEVAELDLETLCRSSTSHWETLSQAIAEGLTLVSYKCDEFKQKKQEDPSKEVKDLYFCIPTDKKSEAEKGLTTGCILGASANVAKKVSNYPGNLMTPTLLAEEIVQQTKDTKIKTTVWDKKHCEKEKMGGLLGVALGSSQEPRFIIMEYKGADSSQQPICFVGKGLTFDSGGISLKPPGSMDEMKFDMCGSSAVLGTLLAIEKLKLKVNVLGLIASSENMPGASANKPGDILKARNGKTMEVLNTDAEGRLILADALSYACEQKPKAIFDAATLTGAIVMALGNLFTGFFTKNESLVQKIQKASQTSGERVWRLPLTAEHTKDMSSPLADVANLSSVRGAGSSTAAAFLEHFVDSSIPWA
ncbi:MAG: leucyl aminopeptidase, partial [Bdellovibrionales bacterium]